MLKPYLSFTAIVLCIGHCLSQSVIKGVVVDDQNTPIYNAHVYFTGIPIGVITNENGHFELESDDSFKSFEVSFVGMQTARIVIVPNKEFYKIVLEEDAALNEVVVVSKPKKRLKKKENPAGKSFDLVPLPLLFQVPANQTFSLEKNTFALLNYYDYITDQYFDAHFEHHFNGFVMNRLPLLKKLNLRFLATFRIAFGTLSESYQDYLSTNLKLRAPDQKPYFEYGIGLENLGLGQVRFFRLDFIWRGPHKSLNGPQSPEFGLRLSVKPTF